MAAMKKVIAVSICMVAAFVFLINADEGSATFYTEQNPSACLGFDTPTTMVASASADIYRDGAGCGLQFSITCTDGTNLGTPHPCTGDSVEVKVVDFCQNCRGTFDLSEDAFAAIADPSAGKILIQYNQV